MEYYFKILKSNEFRYTLMKGVKECLLLQQDKEKIDLIGQAKQDLFNEIAQISKEIETLTNKLNELIVDDEIKKEIQEEIRQEKEKEKEYEKQQITNLKTTKEEKNKTKTNTKTNQKEIYEEAYKENKKTQFKTKDIEPKKDELTSFNYTLEQIEKKLAELKKD